MPVSSAGTDDIEIINVQSYPALHGNWTVRFNTTGTADLTIRAVDGTEFGRDIEFLELRCGDKVLASELTGGAVFVENYRCDETGYDVSKVLIAGKHALEFRFGDDIEYAYNSPGPVSPIEPVTPVDISPSGTSGWQQVNVSSYVPAGAEGICFESYSTSTSEYDWGIRHPDSSDNRPGTQEDTGHQFGCVGVNSARYVDIYKVNAVTHVVLMGYIPDGYGEFKVNAVDKSTSTTATWADVNVSGDFSGGTCAVVFYEVDNVGTTSYRFGTRINGRTNDNRPDTYGNDFRTGMMGLDANEIFEQRIENSVEDLYVHGCLYAGDGVNIVTSQNPISYSTGTTGSYQSTTITDAQADNATGIFFGLYSSDNVGTSSDEYKHAIRKNGDTQDYYAYVDVSVDRNGWIAVDGDQIIEQRIESTTRDLYVWGWTYAPLDTTPPTWQNQGEDTTTPGVGEPVELYADGKDEIALDWAVLSTNESGGVWGNKTVYDSPMDMGDTVDVWNQSAFTWQNSSVTAGTVVAWRIWYNDTSDNWNVTDTRTFTVQAAVPDTLTVSGIDVAPDNVTQGDTNKVMLNLSFSDGSGSVYVEVINVTLSGNAADSDISGVKIYEDVNSNGVYDSGVDTQLNETKTFSGGEVSFGTPGTAMLTVGSAANKSVLVMYDISGSATLDSTVGASIASASYIGVAEPDTVASTNFPIDSGTSVILELSTPPTPTTIKVTMNRMVILDDPMVNLGKSVSCGMSGAGSGYWDTDYWNGEHTTIRAYALAMNQSLVMEGINITFNLNSSSDIVNVNSSLTDSSGMANYSFNMNDLGHGTDGKYTITALNSSYSLSSAVIFTYTYFGCANCHGDPGSSDMNSIGWTTDARSPYSLNANGKKLRMHENPSISAHTSYIQSEDCTYCHMSYGTQSDESIGDTSPNTQQYPLYPWGVHSDDIGNGVVCWKCHPNANVSGQTPPIRGCFNATSCHGSITYAKNTNISTFNTLSGTKAIYSDTYPATGQPLKRHIPGIQEYPDLWELNADEPAPVDFTSGLNSTANTFGPGAGDDGWDWEDSTYGVSGGPPASFVTHGDPSGSSDYTTSGRIEIKVGGSGSGTTDYIASGAWGVQFSITSDEYSKIQGGGEAYISFDWTADDLDGDLEEGVWIKARFGNTTAMTYLGGDQDSGQTYSDTTNEIWASVDNPSSGFSDPTTGTLESDVTSLIRASGEYYLDFGGKVDWVDADSNGKGDNEGLGAYFDNIQLKIVERENAVTCILCHQPMHNISKPGLTPSQAESSSFSNSYTEDYFCKNCHSPRTEHNGQVKCTVCHSQDVHNVGFFDATGSYTTNKSNGGDCTTCHQQTAAWDTLLTQPKVGTYGGSGPPQVPVQIKHSDNATGQRWGSYWTTENELSACNYCHGDTKHSTAALGRPANWSGSNTVNSSINATNNWCAGCHYQGYASGSKSYSDMPPRFTGDGLSPPPEITNHSSYAPTGTAGYFNHSLGDYSDKTCSYCHDGLASSATNITAFVHSVGTGRRCENCHFNWSKMNGTFGKPTAFMNETLFGESVHGTSSVFPSVIFCTSCHTSLSNGTDYHLSIDPGAFTPPQSGWKWCEDCHVVNRPSFESDRHNITSDPPNNMFNSTDSVMDITDCTACHKATIYNNATETYNRTSGKDCRYCHTFPDYDPESPY